MKVRFMSLGSGSSGNSYYLGCDTYGILVDAGIGVRNIRKRLAAVDIPMESIMAIFVTHDHADHIKSLSALGEGMSIPVYATPLTHEGISRSYCVTQKLQSSVRYIEKNCPTQFQDFVIEAFEVPHDGTDNVGYYIQVDGRRFCFLTDLGEITDLAASYIARAGYLVIESNYDNDMLDNGPYPAYLKKRVKSRTGHMCNADTADFLARHFTDRMKHIWLCHLSNKNNTPELAYDTVAQRLGQEGIVAGRDVQLTALQRTAPSELYDLE